MSSVAHLINSFQVNHLRNLNHININGNDIPDPIEDFNELKTHNEWADEKIPEILVKNLLGFNFPEPTPVQMQSIPVMLNVRA